MPASLPVHRFLPLIIQQGVGKQRLGRTPESSRVTEAPDNVAQYDRVGETRLMVSYAIAVEALHRTCGTRRNLALDLACGPGRLTTMLHRHTGFQRLTGIDLSQNMVEQASANSVEDELTEAIDYRLGDVTRLSGLNLPKADACCFADGAHHLESLDAVRESLFQMHACTHKAGVVMLMDLVRLKTDRMTRSYLNLVGRDYLELGLPAFLQDFSDSMYAAWTIDEIRKAVPRTPGRKWYHVFPLGLPCLQIVFGVPEGRRGLYVSSASPFHAGAPTPANMTNEWRLLRRLVFSSRPRRIA